VAIDYSALAFPKTRPKALDKKDKAKALAAKDKAENAKAKKRANGQCEVRGWEIVEGGIPCVCRCTRKDTQTHHLLGGIGRRNKGKSVLAQFKLRVCDSCHAAITANVLKPTTADHDASTVRYWRAK
jgi:hypothetical protein